MDLPDNFEYFDKKSNNIFDRLIKEQGIEVCQDMLHENYIRNQTTEYTFGFGHTIPVAYIGQKTRSKKIQKRLSSFVLCKIETELQYIDITLVCSRKNTKQGKILMGLVEEYARIHKIPYLHLDSLAEPKLLEWYKSQGFIIFKNKMHVSGDIKAHTMIKIL